MNYQKTTIVGRFTHDHELRYTPKGVAVLANTVAVNRKWKDQSGETQERVTYFEIKAFKAQAEALSNYTVKGSPILIEARMENERWEDRETGQPRRREVFLVERFEFMETSKETNQRGAQRGHGGDHEGRQATQQQADPRRGQHPPASSDPDDYEDDIPF